MPGCLFAVDALDLFWINSVVCICFVCCAALDCYSCLIRLIWPTCLLFNLVVYDLGYLLWLLLVGGIVA